MGTNFYIIDKDQEYSEGRHIGKRSAAGWYCWDCGTTLCRDGTSGIHQGQSKWYSSCPECYQEKTPEGLFEGSVGRELGFNKQDPKEKTGVKTCCSFTWAYAPKRFEKDFKGKRGKIIKDEYGEKFSYKQFLEILSECPIQSTWVGQEFS